MNAIGRAALGALLCVPVLGAAQEPEKPQPRSAEQRPHAPGEAMRAADTNQDGKVSFEELQARRPNVTEQAFQRMDTNGDGFLTPADRPAQRQGARGAESDAGEARARMLDKMMLSDANADGQVSFEEISTAKPGFARADFDRIDRNADGVISRADAAQRDRTPQDRPRPPQQREQMRNAPDGDRRAEFRERLRAADANADGSVTFSEAQTAFPQMTRERFDMLDRNGDGAIGPGDQPQGDGARRAP